MKRSRYVIKANSHDQNSKIFYNLRNGKGIKVSNELNATFEDLMKNENLADFAKKYQFLSERDETDQVLDDYKQNQQNDRFHLILLPHQNCNFRCFYCYEKFEKNKMLTEIEEGVVKFVTKRLASKQYKIFSVSWFGGEPLLAPDVIERLSIEFRALSAKYNVRYVAGITTNGYNMTDNVIDMLLENEVTNFQITIDGPKELHDKQRTMVGGQPTYDRIVNNMKKLSTKTKGFRTMIRMNVGEDTLPYVDEHLYNMKNMFSHDKRFQMYFHNIGHWGGDNDSEVSICSENVTLELLNRTIDNDMEAVSGLLEIGTNTACYAANPNSFVIGTDGLVYKCTVALYEDINIVGNLNKDGEMVLDTEKFKLWTDGGNSDSHCKSCFFAPSCHGDHCPLIRIQENKRPCPDSKKQVKEYVQLMDRQGYKFLEIKPKVGV